MATPGQVGNNAEMPFLDHLEELRWRIIWSLVAVVLGVVGAFIILQQFDIFKFLERPILPYLHGNKLKYTHPADPFSVLISASFTIGIVIALPVIFGAIGLFVAGVSLSFFVVLPLAIGWLMNIAANTDALEPMITYREYFSFAVNMSLAFGLCFELPIVILALASLGIVTPEFLRRYRRHAVVLCVVAGALLSPGDLVWTTMLLAAPLYLLYELSVVLTVIVYRKRRKKEAQLAAEEAAEARANEREPQRLVTEPPEDDVSSTAWRGS